MSANSNHKCELEIESLPPDELAELVRPGELQGLDFVTLTELQKKTGVRGYEVVRFALAEMLCNSLDTDATCIYVELTTLGAFYWLTVSDNGNKKLTLGDIRLLLDFSNKASSKRGIKRVQRGYLGNALKCIFGYSYALAEASSIPPPQIVVSSHGTCFCIDLKPDRVKCTIRSDIKTAETDDDGLNTFKVAFPATESRVPMNALRDLISAISLVNPERRINFNLWALNGALGEAQGGKPLRKETSVLWYTAQEFYALFLDFVRAKPDIALKVFISMFRGFARKKKMRDILHDLNSGGNHDSSSQNTQFVPSTPISALTDSDIERLYSAMNSRAKPVSNRSILQVLGIVGEDEFERIRQRNRWERLRYIAIKGNQDEENRVYPYILELAVFDRGKSDADGLKVFQCVNFAASKEDLFSGSFDIKYRLGRVGIGMDMPVTVLVHFICPVLEWLNYAKSGLRSKSLDDLLKKAFDKILPIPRTPRVYHPPPPPKPLSWVPCGEIGRPEYEERLRLFAQEMKAIDAQRTTKMKFSSRGWGYFLENLTKIDKGEFDQCQKAINDCRKIGFLPIDFVAEDQDETRRFNGIHEASEPTIFFSELKDQVEEMLRALPSQTTDYWQGERFYVMMCVEKGDIKNLFKPVCGEYNVPIVSSKGWYPILLRYHIAQLSMRAEKRGLTPVLLLFYDHDPAGLKITQSFRKGLDDIERATGWSNRRLIIDRFGLNKNDIEKYGLTWIENLKTSSGKESRDSGYVMKYGRRKCESNALFKNEETLKAAEEICRNAIEKYYGQDALERFREKERQSKARLNEIYEDPVWSSFYNGIDKLIQSLAEKPAEPEKRRNISIANTEKEVEVSVDNKYYGRCPRCGVSFNYDETFIDKLVRCQRCHAPLRLRKADTWRA